MSISVWMRRMSKPCVCCFTSIILIAKFSPEIKLVPYLTSEKAPFPSTPPKRYPLLNSVRHHKRTCDQKEWMDGAEDDFAYLTCDYISFELIQSLDH